MAWRRESRQTEPQYWRIICEALGVKVAGRSEVGERSVSGLGVRIFRE